MHVIFLPDEITAEISAGETILDASLREGLDHAHVCGGKARCSTCRVRVVQGLERCAPRGPEEARLAAELGLAPDIRLACQTRILGSVTVRRVVTGASRPAAPAAAPGSAAVERNLAVLVARLEGVARLVDALPPADGVLLMERSLAALARRVEEQGGVPVVVRDEGLVAVFRSPEEGALHAVRAGLNLLDEAIVTSAETSETYGRALAVHVGVAWGRVVLGSIGVGETRRTVAAGPVVAEARRLAAHVAAGRLLVSEGALAKLAGRVVAGAAVKLPADEDLPRGNGHLVPGVRGDRLAGDGEWHGYPMVKEDKTCWVRIAPDGALNGRDHRPLALGPARFIVWRPGGSFIATEATCPHRGLPLTGSRIEEGDILVCPWHQSRFKLADGEVDRWAPLVPKEAGLKERRLKSWPVRERDGWLWIGLPAADLKAFDKP